METTPTPARVPALFRRLVAPFAPGPAVQTAGRDSTSPGSAFQRSGLHRAVPYLLAAASVALATYVALFLERQGVRSMEFPLFLLAVASTFRYPGAGPAFVAAGLSAVVFDYYFTEPRYSLRVSASDLPYWATFLLLALMVAQRKRREEQVKRLNEQLQRRTAQLEAANGELEAFAYSTSHDLRAPLRHMVGFAEMLQNHASSAFDEKSRRYMATILEAAKRMGQLIDDLLGFSRIGRAEVRETTVSLDQVVKEVVAELRPEVAGRNVSWRVGALPQLHGDRSMLRVVFVNLITNALKFTRTRAQAEVEIGSFDDEHRGVVVFVRDNGVGFDMKYSNKLFGVFQRLHRADEFEGTGIGLATVQRVIHRHGGTVWASGYVNGGATFFLSVPAAARR